MATVGPDPGVPDELGKLYADTRSAGLYPYVYELVASGVAPLRSVTTWELHRAVPAAGGPHTGRWLCAGNGCGA